MPTLLLLLACGSPTPATPSPPDDHATRDDHATHATHAEHDDHAPSKDALALSLNGDAKWSMDEHTRKVMAETRNTLAGGQLATVEDAAALEATLQEQLDRLLQGCTMDGAAHDELHVFLMAYMPAVKKLGTATDVDAAREQVEGLRSMVATYDEYFE